MPEPDFVTPLDLPVTRGDLEDLILHRQIVHLYLDATGETIGFVPGVPTAALEMDNADVHLFAAFPDANPHSDYIARIMWRMIERPLFIQKSKQPYYLVGQADLDLTDVQKKARGQIIKGARRLTVPGREHGEIVLLDWTDGRTLKIEGGISRFAVGDLPLASMDLEILDPERRTFDLGAPSRPRGILQP